MISTAVWHPERRTLHHSRKTQRNKSHQPDRLPGSDAAMVLIFGCRGSNVEVQHPVESRLLSLSHWQKSFDATVWQLSFLRHPAILAARQT